MVIDALQGAGVRRRSIFQDVKMPDAVPHKRNWLGQLLRAVPVAVLPAVLPVAPGTAATPEPFLFRGLALAQQTQGTRLQGLRAAEARFPDLAACIRPDTLPDPRLHWGALRSREDMEVCLFRIAAHLGDARAIADWMAAEGFPPPRIHAQPAGQLRHLGSDGPGTIVISEWGRSQRPFPFSTLPLLPWGIRAGFGAHALSVAFYLSADGSPLHVDAQFSFK
jgi:hypothetical protein